MPWAVATASSAHGSSLAAAASSSAAAAVRRARAARRCGSKASNSITHHGRRHRGDAETPQRTSPRRNLPVAVRGSWRRNSTCLGTLKRARWSRTCSLHVVLAETGAATAHDVGGEHLPVTIVGDADDCGVDDVGVGGEQRPRPRPGTRSRRRTRSSRRRVRRRTAARLRRSGRRRRRQQPVDDLLAAATGVALECAAAADEDPPDRRRQRPRRRRRRGPSRSTRWRHGLPSPGRRRGRRGWRPSPRRPPSSRRRCRGPGRSAPAPR